MFLPHYEYICIYTYTYIYMDTYMYMCIHYYVRTLFSHSHVPCLLPLARVPSTRTHTRPHTHTLHTHTHLYTHTHTIRHTHASHTRHAHAHTQFLWAAHVRVYTTMHTLTHTHTHTCTPRLWDAQTHRKHIHTQILIQQRAQTQGTDRETHKCTDIDRGISTIRLLCVEVCCRVCCSVLQCVAVNTLPPTKGAYPQYASFVSSFLITKGAGEFVIAPTLILQHTVTHSATHLICRQLPDQYHQGCGWIRDSADTHTATHCNTLHHTLQHTSFVGSFLIGITKGVGEFVTALTLILQHTATHCNTLCNTPPL